MEEIKEEVLELKKKNNAVILAHNYQRPEIQDIADYVGDSLALAKAAAETKAGTIVFCGVDFMAETAAILNPDKKVLIPDKSAVCPMALMLSVEDLKAARKLYPEAEVVLYINTTASAKTEADCICTSANAVEVVASMKSDTIIFGPDKNLAHYVSKRTEKKIIPVPEHGVCPTHHQISLEDVLAVKKQHPDAKVITHPEAIPEVQDIADHIASTSGMVSYVKGSREKEFIIVTEKEMVYRLSRDAPDKVYYPIESAVCPPMKMITLEKLRESLLHGRYPVVLDRPTAYRARKAVDCMLSLGI